jgi:hypothetical protein
MGILVNKSGASDGSGNQLIAWVNTYHSLEHLSLIRTIKLSSSEGSLLTVGFYEALVVPSSVKVAKKVNKACSQGQEYYSVPLPLFLGAVT